MSDNEAGGGGEASPAKLTDSARKRRRSSERAAKTPDKKKDEAPPAAVKEEPANDSDSDDDAPLALKAAKTKKSAAKKPAAKKPSAKKPAAKKKPATKKKSAKKPAAKAKKPAAKAKKRPAETLSESDDDDDESLAGPAKKKKAAKGKASGKKAPPAKKPKKEKVEEPEEPIYRWWLKEPLPEGQKWVTLDHKGPLFPPAYEPLPKSVYLKYDGEPCPLAPDAEEVAGFYAGMLKRDYVTKKVFNDNFMKCWKDKMTKDEKAKITDLSKCDFGKIAAHIDAQTEKRKAATKEDKEVKKLKEKAIKEEYGYAVIDDMRQAVGNFRVEPPGLFQGRGEHPKMGMLKYRLSPEDVRINVSDLSKAPPAPDGHKWKEIICDNKVSWLATWTENIQNQNKYVMFAADSHIKCQKDHEKYEIARKLKHEITGIRKDYTANLKSKEMVERQKATALYFIDKLALRAGGEKDTDEAADTVGCCNLRYEHVFFSGETVDGEVHGVAGEHKVTFDFLGKDSIRYFNTVDVDHQVWKNVRIFKKAPKKEGDDLFDRLDVPLLNKYLKDFLPGLTAKTFRTYNASITLQEELKKTPVDGSDDEKVLAYNRANRQVAILCNHQRAEGKAHESSMAKMQEDSAGIDTQIKEAKKALKAAKADKDEKKKAALKKKIEGLMGRKIKKEIKITDKEENKTIALGTSKLNYLDPRISVQWCKTHNVDIKKVYNKTQAKKFRWAIEMIKDATEPFVF